MANDPKYVRLSDRLSSGTLVDTYSHWGISGLDVVEFPEEGTPAAQTFVRTALRRGLLEAASRAEYEEVQQANETVASARNLTDEDRRRLATAGQEASIVRAAHKEGTRLAASRAGTGQGSAYEADQKRREAILAVQNDLDDGEVAMAQTPRGAGAAALTFGDDNPMNTVIHSEQGGSSDALLADNGRTVPSVAGLGEGSIPQTSAPVESEAPKKSSDSKRSSKRESKQEQEKQGE